MKNDNLNRRIFIKNIGLGSVGMLWLGSCSSDKFLDVAPKTVLDSQSFYKSVDNLVTGVNGVYGSLRILYESYTSFQTQEVVSDNVQQSSRDQPERTELDGFRADSTNNTLREMWQLSYKLIDLANIVVKNGGNVEGDVVLIDRVVGEAKFLRALVYFELVKYWGSVPLRLVPTTNFEDPGVANSDVSVIYNQIIQDLEDASAVLPASYDGGRNQEQGRATKYAAQTLLGKVFLQQGNKAEAKRILESLVGKFNLIDYKDIYKAGNVNSEESIFEIGFNRDNNTGMRFNNSFIPKSEAERLGIVAGGNTDHFMPYRPTMDLVDSYELGDIRKDASIGFDQEDQKPYISKFIDLGAISRGSNINFVVLRYADVLLSLAEAIGENNVAYSYINEVRSRAGLNPIDSSTPGTFAQKLQQERRVEFAFERHRWSDLLRLPEDEVISIMERQLFEQTGENISIPKYKLLYPLPIFEIRLSDGKVKQNPGY